MLASAKSKRVAEAFLDFGVRNALIHLRILPPAYATRKSVSPKD